MSMSFSYTPRGRSFMVMSNIGASELIVVLGLQEQFIDDKALRVGDLRKRFARAKKHVPKSIRDNLITLEVATGHLLNDDWVYVR